MRIRRHTSGVPAAGRLLRGAGGYAGIAAGHIVNLLNPPLIVLAGGTMSVDCARVLLEVIRREAGASASEVAFAKTKIVNSPLDRLSAARGAAPGATRPVLRDYRIRLSRIRSWSDAPRLSRGANPQKH